MAKLIRCKSCGSTKFTEVEGLFQCDHCRHKTPKPNKNTELLERANAMRVETKDFDEAAVEYEKIIHQTPDDAEAYWGRVLCRYGIEYVEDINGKYLPTCHRTINSSIFDDADYIMAIKYAEPGMSDCYRAEAQIIDKYQTKIKEIASKEEPYDVFISFKAEDNFGKKTEDSIIAQDLYYYLTKTLKLKVFFSEITLKDKVGQEYEPIIYAALESAPVMILVGTKPEYINSTWVKNEWSRYAKMVAESEAQNRPSKHLVCALKGMKYKQLPSALAKYQTKDLDEIGGKETLCRDIDNIIIRVRREKSEKEDGRDQSQKKEYRNAKDDIRDSFFLEADNYCKIGFDYLEVKNFTKARENFETAVNKKPDYALAHWGQLLAEKGAVSDDNLAVKAINIKTDPIFHMAMKYASPEEKVRFERVANLCRENCEHEAEFAEAKRRHNREYRQEVCKLKENYAANSKNNRLAFDEKADDLFNEYFNQQNQQEKLAQRHEKISRRTSLFDVSFFLGAAVSFLICAILVVLSAKTGYQPNSKWVLWSLFCFSALLIFIPANKFLPLQWAILIALAVGAVGTFFLLLAMLYLQEAFIPLSFVISLTLLGIGVLWLVKRIRTRLLKRSLASQIAKCENVMHNIWEDIGKRSIEQLTEINQRYYNQYDDEIDTYESNDVIVQKCLHK